MEYKFKKVFQVADQGKMVDAEKIIVTAPNNLVNGPVSALDSAFSKAIMKAAEFSKSDKAEKKEATELKGSDIVMLLGASDCPLDKCFQSLKEILLATGKINDAIKITSGIFDKMSYEDTKELLGLYIKDFLYISRQD